MTIKSLLKDWTLPISMVVGTVSYIMLTQIEALQSTKEALAATVPYLLPSLIFVMLLFSYSKIEPRELKPRKWHLWHIIIQTTEVLVMVGGSRVIHRARGAHLPRHGLLSSLLLWQLLAQW